MACERAIWEIYFNKSSEWQFRQFADFNRLWHHIRQIQTIIMTIIMWSSWYLTSWLGSLQYSWQTALWLMRWLSLKWQRIEGPNKSPHKHQLKVPRRVVAIEIRQGRSQISRKNNFSIWDQICPTIGYFHRTRNVRIRIRAYSEIMIPSGIFSNTNAQATELCFQPAIAVFLWLF